MNAEEIYLIKLLAWFYGMDYEAVRNTKWTQKEINEAQDYSENREDIIAKMRRNARRRARR